MARKTNTSQAAFERASRVLVGGVNSPVRAFAAVGGTPPVIARASGPHITDVDGNTYIDYVGSYGPAILGHAPPEVIDAVARAAARGVSYGATTEIEAELAEMIVAALPSARKVRFVSSGTEAVMTAVRLARGTTGRDKIVKIVGCYHGHSDAMLVSAGSGATTLGTPSSPGVPASATSDTLLAAFNDLDAMKQVFAGHGPRIAAVLVEPIAGNMGVVPPAAGYLAGLRGLCDESGAMLIFDEVMTGFRVGYGGAQTLYGVRPDITTLGKIIGGGMPVGAIAAGAEIMNNLAPEGNIYQAGTLSGNPITMTAGVATLKQLQAEGFYERLEAVSAELAAGLARAAEQAGLAGKVTVNRVGSMLTCFFGPPPVTDYAAATAGDTRAFAGFFGALLDDGIYIAPSQYEAMFVSIAHTALDIAGTIDAAARAFSAATRLMVKPQPGR